VRAAGPTRTHSQLAVRTTARTMLMAEPVLSLVLALVRPHSGANMAALGPLLVLQVLASAAAAAATAAAAPPAPAAALGEQCAGSTPPPFAPTWAPNWNLTESTAIQPNGNSYFDPKHSWVSEAPGQRFRTNAPSLCPVSLTDPSLL
jgi:hypothetical protein